jgi:hypothetical protein
VQQHGEPSGDGPAFLKPLRRAIAKPHFRKDEVRLIFNSSTLAAS